MKLWRRAQWSEKELTAHRAYLMKTNHCGGGKDLSSHLVKKLQVKNL